MPNSNASEGVPRASTHRVLIGEFCDPRGWFGGLDPRIREAGLDARVSWCFVVDVPQR